MTFADWLILVAIFLPYLTVAYAKASAQDTFNNADPRNEEGYKGVSLRAYNAHLNGLESFPFFAIAVLFAEWRGASEFWIGILAAVYIFCRLIYTVMYLQDKPSYRSPAFTLSFLVAVAIFVLPFWVH